MRGTIAAGLLLAWAGLGAGAVQAQSPTAAQPLRGAAAFGDWRTDAPGVRRHITPQDLPPPYATRSASNSVHVAPPPPGAALQVPPGFTVEKFAGGLRRPRVLRVAPNGDVFVAETTYDQIRVLRPGADGRTPARTEVYASGLDDPFGIAFYPPGPDPQWIYVANTNDVVRFAYRNGDLAPRGKPETVVARLAETTGGHSTRDIAFSGDGKRMFVSVGSGSNVAGGLGRKSPDEIRRWEAANGLGAAWDDEAHRAAVLVFDPDGRNGRVFATGIRNCVGLAVQPATDVPWCSTNERDGLGDDLVPDYVTRVREHAFYGWPWWYIGDHEEPRHDGERPDLRGHVTVPDVLLQAHSASLGMAFYPATATGAAAFPSDYRGDGFAALHGSWNRSRRTGYKLVRILMKDGMPTGAYEDFLTGFAIDDTSVWGRPVGVAVARDGALLVSEDGNGTIWRIAYTGARAAAR
jgi:glucose/arabinose dehydrogenase